MARVGRGAVVALPALGAFFIAHLARQDWARLAEERAAGRRWAARAFGVAFLGDVLDVGMHALVVVGLLHHHFQVCARVYACECVCLFVCARECASARRAACAGVLALLCGPPRPPCRLARALSPLPPPPGLRARARAQVGVPIAHSLVHAVEAGGAGVAIVSTVAATLGEVIAARAAYAAQLEVERARVNAAAAAAVEAIDAAAGLGPKAPPAGEAAAAGGQQEPEQGQQQQAQKEEQGEAAGWRWEESGSSGDGAGADARSGSARARDRQEL